jgi:hypothetical protein
MLYGFRSITLYRLEVKSLAELVAGPDKQGQAGDASSQPRSKSGVGESFYVPLAFHLLSIMKYHDSLVVPLM